MKKKIKELTDEQLYLIVYENELGEPITYKDRPAYPDNNELPAKDITYDNCRFCKKERVGICFPLNCERRFIDFDAIRNSIYAEDEVEIYD